MRWKQNPPTFDPNEGLSSMVEDPQLESGGDIYDVPTGQQMTRRRDTERGPEMQLRMAGAANPDHGKEQLVPRDRHGPPP